MVRKSTKSIGLKSVQSSTERRIAAFEKEMVKLEAKNFKLEAENARLKARIKVLEVAAKASEPPSKTDMLDAARRIAFTLASAGMHIVDSSGKKVSS